MFFYFIRHITINIVVGRRVMHIIGVDGGDTTHLMMGPKKENSGCFQIFVGIQNSK
jgi:hypothetical protein